MSGRPPIDAADRITETVATRLPSLLALRLRQRAELDGVTVGEVIRRALQSFLSP